MAVVALVVAGAAVTVVRAALVVVVAGTVVVVGASVVLVVAVVLGLSAMGSVRVVSGGVEFGVPPGKTAPMPTPRVRAPRPATPATGICSRLGQERFPRSPRRPLSAAFRT